MESVPFVLVFKSPWAMLPNSFRRLVVQVGRSSGSFFRKFLVRGYCFPRSWVDHASTEVLDIDVCIRINRCWAVGNEVSWQPWSLYFIVVDLVCQKIYCLLGNDVGMLEGGALGERFKRDRFYHFIRPLAEEISLHFISIVADTRYGARQSQAQYLGCFNLGLLLGDTGGMIVGLSLGVRPYWDVHDFGRM